MTKKETTTPVVKEEKVKAKRGRKPKAAKEVIENPQQVNIPSLSPAPISEQDPKVVELQAQLDLAQKNIDLAQKNNMDLLAQVEDKTKAYDNLRTTYNKLLEDYKVEKNRNKQVSKALEDAKARATEYKSSWNAAKAARDQFASDTAKAEKDLSQVKKELADTKFDRDTFVTDWKKARMLSIIFGIAFVASLIVSFVIAFA